MLKIENLISLVLVDILRFKQKNLTTFYNLIFKIFRYAPNKTRLRLKHDRFIIFFYLPSKVLRITNDCVYLYLCGESNHDDFFL